MSYRPHILIYGDSNSWGYLDDGAGQRYERAWPQEMQRHLLQNHDIAIDLTTETLPGRTTAFPDPQEGPEYNGLPYLRPALLSHAPIDMVLIMLGTNDCKARFDATAAQITSQMMQLAKIVRRTPVGPGKWREGPPPLAGIICPAKLGERTRDPNWLRYEEWLGGYDKAAAFGSELEALLADCHDEGIFLLDANEVITPSSADPIHWPAAEHHHMGAYMADMIAPRLQSLTPAL